MKERDYRHGEIKTSENLVKIQKLSPLKFLKIGILLLFSN